MCPHPAHGDADAPAYHEKAYFLSIIQKQHSGWYYLFFFLSGLTALVNETAFVCQLQLIFGRTLSALPVVIAVFCGLAIGATLIGPRVDRHTPLRLYGLLEIGTGFWPIIAVIIIRNVYASLLVSLQLPGHRKNHLTGHPPQ
ncbi:hypothetical protein AMJ74_01020 [candidate division WOR_3 bacterium SM1_77]|uniref:Uncharacterized protein n=1 Tax=candidate division WOR_3 bacterium SM1_77 TaxID=1703778 RepID=A0A0S8K264_UNCW3|nr:MAG: hypothetical protein AMJ74_01020 [candidate division WOR_3 bacterium SM1_77]